MRWRGLASGLLLVSLAAAFPRPAAAEDTYVYWSLWLGDGGTWAYAQSGAGSIGATDGAVVGWQFKRSDDNVSAPAAAADFETICGGVERSESSVRVAQVIDFGAESNYSNGESAPATISECISVPQGSTMATVLLAEHSVRDEGGFVCAVDNLPSAGCAEPVADKPTAKAAQAAESNETPWLGAIALLLVVTSASVARLRRGRRRP